ncbi:hypothetical protein L3X38_031951 [Prunus dulcis]|uniref:Uncharacterized protein n=1 Tax=Prunus dulcis TaxID=3755 RepID=A0AAD4VEK7_PRUDU|nr:hypothetical protein L3X38_031951 [Prunus dulcis]
MYLFQDWAVVDGDFMMGGSTMCRSRAMMVDLGSRIETERVVAARPCNLSVRLHGDARLGTVKRHGGMCLKSALGHEAEMRSSRSAQGLDNSYSAGILGRGLGSRKCNIPH